MTTPGSARRLLVAEHLWESLQAMSRQMGLEQDVLVAQALLTLARLNGFELEGRPAQARALSSRPTGSSDDEETVAGGRPLAITLVTERAPRVTERAEVPAQRRESLRAATLGSRGQPDPDWADEASCPEPTPVVALPPMHSEPDEQEPNGEAELIRLLGSGREDSVSGGAFVSEDDFRKTDEHPVVDPPEEVEPTEDAAFGRSPDLAAPEEDLLGMPYPPGEAAGEPRHHGPEDDLLGMPYPPGDPAGEPEYADEFAFATVPDPEADDFENTPAAASALLEGDAAAPEPSFEEAGPALWVSLDGAEAVQVAGARFVIGRGKHCDLVVPSDRVSREHAVITRASGQLQLEDLGSVNGTWHNRQRIDQKSIEDGDEFYLGSEHVCMRCEFSE